MNNTFVFLSRSILESEVFASQKMLKIWIYCLCKANYKTKKVPIKIGRGETVVTVNRGQFIFGRYKAKEDLNIDGSTIYKILKKLEKIGNIVVKSNNHYSIVTVCNYDYYNSIDTYKVTANEQQTNSKVTANEQPSNTTNKDNNEKKDNKFNNFISIFNELTNKRYTTKNTKARTQFNARIKDGFTIDDFKLAIINCKNDDYHRSNSLKYLTPEFITRADKLERFLNAPKRQVVI